MKKTTAILLAVLLAAALLASCGSGSHIPKDAPAPAAERNNEFGLSNQSASEDKSDAGESYAGTSNDDADTGLVKNTKDAALSAEKMIYSYSATVETKKYDETLGSLGALLEQYGAFIQSSYVSGSRYDSGGLRSADYTIRVPVANFASLTGGLDTLGNVYNENTSAQNITAQFTDAQSRLHTYEIEESRLLSMLEKADTVEDMIAIEARLSDVRYQIESLTSTLRNWQNEVDYSTVSLHIAEVEELKDQLSAQRTYWEKIGDGFTATLKGIGNFFKGLFMAVIVASPVILILAVIAAAVLVILRITRKKKRNPPPPPGNPQ